MSKPPFFVFESSYPLEPFNGELAWLLFFYVFFAILACNFQKMVYSMCVVLARVSHPQSQGDDDDENQ